MVTATERKPMDYYLKLRYPATFYPDETGGYVVAIEDLPGCYAQGDTVEEASEMIEIARKMWIESAYEDGWDIPLPRTERQYSGKFNVRVPKELHRKLDRAAEREGVSLNQFLVSTLSRAVGREEASQPKASLVRESASPKYKTSAKGRRSQRSKG